MPDSPTSQPLQVPNLETPNPEGSTTASMVTALVTPTSDPTQVEWIALTWDDRRKARQRVQSDQGTELLLNLPRGTVLADGDCVLDEGKRQIRIRAAAEAVLVIPFQDLETLGQVAHHLGNWHRPAQILADGTMIAQADEPLQDWCRHHGLACEWREQPFHANVRGHSH
ncbi:MAG: hypothetical protein OHK0012_21980 [Synechococcales cyanobacterium]